MVLCLPDTFLRRLRFAAHRQVRPHRRGSSSPLEEYNAAYRQVFLDGRALPEDPNPAWNGYSVGRWEGDALVVDSLGFRDDLWLDRPRQPADQRGPGPRTDDPGRTSAT